MNILVACEESQRVCMAFREKGHRAFSCDVIECSGGHSEWHIKQDVIPLLNGCCEFTTCDGTVHKIDSRWDMIIAHPPCTFLTVAGACNIPKDPTRIEKGQFAAEFFMKIYNCHCNKICIENPVPMKRFNLPEYQQIIHPYEYGHHAFKRTCLWLKGLPLLKPTNIIELTDDDFSPVRYYKGKKKRESKWYNSAGHGKGRSKTFPGIAKAMAEQWG